ncbi:MAG TPA: porin [Noviherbaspirillum sp.]|nr:porin [Noviherbaspirillum sp.]
MKKSLLALAVLGAFAGAASAQTNVTIYGVVDAGVYRTDNGVDSVTGLGSGLQSGSRIGFKGTEDLGGGLSAIFTLENGFNADTGTLAQSDAANTRLFGRQAWVGLQGGFGAVKLGRQYAPIRVAVESIDPFGLGLAGNAANMFNVYGERTDNTINYTTNNFGGFVGQAAYSFGEVAGDTKTGRQIGLSGAYNNGPIRAVLAYHRQELATGAVQTGNADTIMVGGAYDFGVAKLHAAYARNDGETAAGVTSVDSDDMMIGVSAPIGAGTVLASYTRRSNDIGTNTDSDMWAIGYTYALSKRTNFYTSYARIKNDAGARQAFGTSGFGSTTTTAGAGGVVAGEDPSTFNVGIRHTF